METLDVVNFIWQTAASLAVWSHVYMLWKEKEVDGVSRLAFSFFFFFCLWLTYYFITTGYPLSAVGSSIGAIGNLTWVALSWYYRGWRYGIDY